MVTQSMLSSDIATLWGIAVDNKGKFSPDVFKQLKLGLQNPPSLVATVNRHLSKWVIPSNNTLARSALLFALVGQEIDCSKKRNLIDTIGLLAEREGLDSTGKLDTLLASTIIGLPSKPSSEPFAEEAQKVKRAFPIMIACDVPSEVRVRVGELVFARDVVNSTPILQSEYNSLADTSIRCKAIINDGIGLSQFYERGIKHEAVGTFSPITDAGKILLDEVEQAHIAEQERLSPWGTLDLS